MRPVEGLCAQCAHARQIATSKGSAFTLCARSADDPAFAKYPRLPVVACRGFEPRLESRDPSEDPSC